jgi:hypothetical protein
MMKTLRIQYVKPMLLTVLLSLFTHCTDQAKSQQTTSPPSVRDGKKKIQIALLLDTSNSMDGLIDQAKSQLWNIVNELAGARCGSERPVLQIALYEYGNDNLPSSEGYIRQVTPLTSDLDQISKDLFELRTNGGDEFCGEVITRALKQLDWSQSANDLQLIYIAGNEPFTQGRVDYRTACANAREKHVIVNTIHCGDFDEGINGSWKNGADLTGGCYASIEQNRKTVYIESPYDKRIAELNRLLNDTYIPYGSTGYEKKEMQAKQDDNASQYGSVNYVKRAVSKSSAVYENSSWDLVDASKNKNVDVKEVPASQLPEEMQKMQPVEREAYVSAKLKEREEIQSEINTLNKQREEYVAQNTSSNSEDDMLDQAILGALRNQAKERNFTIE